MGLGLAHGGIAVVGQSVAGVGGSVVALSGVGDVGTYAGLQLQMFYWIPFCKACGNESGVLGFRFVVQQVADGVAHLAVVDVYAGWCRVVVERSVLIIYRGIGRMRDGSVPGVGSKHRAAVRHARHLVVGAVGIDAHEEGGEDVALVVGMTSVALQSRVQQNALLVAITAADAVARDFVAANCRQLVILREGRLQGSILPVVRCGRGV